MASNTTTSDSEGEGSSVEVIKTPEGSPPADELAAPQSVLSIRHRNVSKKRSERLKGRDSAEETIAVMVSAPSRPWEYQAYDGDKTVDSIIGRVKGPDGSSWYRIEFESGKKDKVSTRTFFFQFRFSLRESCLWVTTFQTVKLVELRLVVTVTHQVLSKHLPSHCGQRVDHQ